MSRRLSADERALWDRVTATVTPLHAAARPAAGASAAPAVAADTPPPQPARRSAGPRKAAPAPAAPAPPAPAAIPAAARAPVAPAETLDSRWDRKIRSGRLVPDATVDLHGMTVEAARHYLHRRLFEAEARGARVVLVITGKGSLPGPTPADLMPGFGGGIGGGTGGGRGMLRGAIRAHLPRWLGEDRLSERIAAVRRAHPVHGGAGAVYVILKRPRWP